MVVTRLVSRVVVSQCGLAQHVHVAQCAARLARAERLGEVNELCALEPRRQHVLRIDGGDHTPLVGTERLAVCRVKDLALHPTGARQEHAAHVLLTRMRAREANDEAMQARLQLQQWSG